VSNRFHCVLENLVSVFSALATAGFVDSSPVLGRLGPCPPLPFDPRHPLLASCSCAGFLPYRVGIPPVLFDELDSFLVR